MRRGPYWPHLYLVREDGEPALRLWALSALIHDRADQAPSYQQYVNMLRDKVRVSGYGRVIWLAYLGFGFTRLRVQIIRSWVALLMGGPKLSESGVSGGYLSPSDSTVLRSGRTSGHRYPHPFL